MQEYGLEAQEENKKRRAVTPHKSQKTNSKFQRFVNVFSNFGFGIRGHWDLEFFLSLEFLSLPHEAHPGPAPIQLICN
jgi:hypothetical protein